MLPSGFLLFCPLDAMLCHAVLVFDEAGSGAHCQAELDLWAGEPGCQAGLDLGAGEPGCQAGLDFVVDGRGRDEERCQAVLDFLGGPGCQAELVFDAA